MSRDNSATLTRLLTDVAAAYSDYSNRLTHPDSGAITFGDVPGMKSRDSAITYAINEIGRRLGLFGDDLLPTQLFTETVLREKPTEENGLSIPEVGHIFAQHPFVLAHYDFPEAHKVITALSRNSGLFVNYRHFQTTNATRMGAIYRKFFRNIGTLAA